MTIAVRPPDHVTSMHQGEAVQRAKPLMAETPPFLKSHSSWFMGIEKRNGTYLRALHIHPTMSSPVPLTPWSDPSVIFSNLTPNWWHARHFQSQLIGTRHNMLSRLAGYIYAINQILDPY
ncbi:hypothetical protein C8R48DRAFT_677232 [Suillus tomentosus]|nr:hypothetical protein C8R48DRAFT_677232 [Suillus tomentosus]